MADVSPLREKLKNTNEFITREWMYALSRVRVRLDEEIRQPIFMDFIWVFDTLYDQRSRPLEGLWCKGCHRFKRCTKGMRQACQCFAYFLWSDARMQSPMNTDTQREVLQHLPLDTLHLNPLMTYELLGVFFFHGISLLTLVDLSKVSLRSRIMESQENNSPYLLTL